MLPTPEIERCSILIVDDDEPFRARLARSFERRGWIATSAGSGAEALALLKKNSYHLATLDLRMPSENGLDVVRAFREVNTTIRIFVLTGYGSIATALEAVRFGADRYLSKPIDAEQIINAFTSLTSLAGHPEASVTVPSLARVEWEHIQRVLTDCEGNISQAAKQLGLHRRSLQRKLSKYPPRQ